MSHGVRRIGLDGIIIPPHWGQPRARRSRLPTGLAFDAMGDLVVADFKTARIWKIDASGVASPEVGNGSVGSTGRWRPSSRRHDQRRRIWPSGRLARCTSTIGPWAGTRSTRTGIVRPFAGNGTAGFSGDSGQATPGSRSRRRNDPVALAWTGPATCICLTRTTIGSARSIRRDHHHLRRQRPVRLHGDGGDAVDAAIDHPRHRRRCHRQRLLLDRQTRRCARSTRKGVITTVAGTGQSAASAGDCGPARSMPQLSRAQRRRRPRWHSVIVDAGNNRIRAVVL